MNSTENHPLGRFLLTLAVVVAIAASLLMLLRGRSPRDDVDLHSDRAAEATEQEEEPHDDLYAPPKDERAPAVVDDDEAEPEEEVAIQEDDLALRLRAIGVAFGDQDGEALQKGLESVVAELATVEAILDLLRREALRNDGAATLGAMIALETALVLHGRPDGPDPQLARAVVRAVLHALPEISEPVRAELIRRVMSASFGGAPILDARFLRDVLDLRLAWPELREAFTPLLANLGKGLKGEAGLESFYQILATEEGDPLAVKLALSALLEDGSEAYLSLALQMYEETDDPRLRAAVATAVLKSAPIESAVRALDDLSETVTQVNAFGLGSREGGVEALHDEYERQLAAGGGSTKTRMLLVAGMKDAPDEMLLDITRTEPDAGIRGRAWINLTMRKGVELSTVEALEQNWRSGGHGVSSLASITMAAGNALGMGTASARALARVMLLEIAQDASLSGDQRRLAAGKIDRIEPGTLPEELRSLLEDG